MRALLLVIILFFGITWCNGQEKDAARSIWMEGYEALNRAETAFKNNTPLVAVQDYERALEVFKKVQKEYPDWNVGLINYRIKYCQEKIDSIKKDNQDNMAFLSREELLAKITILSGDNQTLKNSAAALQEELATARRSLERARAEAAGQAALEENLRIIRNDRDTLAQQVRLLTAQLATVKEDLAKALLPSPQLQQLPELQKQLSDATTRLSALNREMSALANARDDLLAKYNRENARNDSLSSKIVEVQRKSSELERQLHQVEERLSERDNELLRVRGELTRAQEENSRKLTQITDEDGAKLRKAEAALKSREEQLSSVRGELLTVRRKLESAEQNVSRLNDELEALKKRGVTTATELAELQASNAEQVHLREQNEKLTQQDAVQKELLSNLEKENNEQKRIISELEDKVSIELRDGGELKSTVSAEQKERECLESELNAEQRARKDLENKLSSAQKEYNDLESKLSAEQNLRKEAEARLANSDKEVARLKKSISAADSAAMAANSANDVAMTAFKRQIGEVRHELEQVKQQQTAVTARLTASQEQVAQLQQMLKQKNDEYASTEQNLREQLKSQQEENERIQQELSDKNNALSVELKQREMRDKAQDGIMTEARENAGKLNELNAELDRVKNELANALIANEALKQQYANEGEQITSSQAEAAIKKQQELEMALIRRENERKQLTSEIRRLEAELNKSEEELAAAKKRLFPVATASAEAPVAQPVVKETAAKAVSSDTLSDDEIVMRGYLRQGVAAERSGKLEAAVFNYNEALKLVPDSLLALKRLGIIAYNSGKSSEAAKYLERAMRLSPDDREILIALGFTQLRLNQPRWALANLARASAVAPNDGATSRLFATALGALQWREAAIAEYRHALEINPKDGEAAYNLALMALAYSSEISLNAQNDSQMRDALKRYAQYQRADGLKWYRQAIANGAQPDPALEAALKK